MSEDPVTQATLGLHRHIIPFWNLDDPKNEDLSLGFGWEAHLVPWKMFCSMSDILLHLKSMAILLKLIVLRKWSHWLWLNSPLRELSIVTKYYEMQWTCMSLYAMKLHEPVCTCEKHDPGIENLFFNFKPELDSFNHSDLLPLRASRSQVPKAAAGREHCACLREAKPELV